MSNAKQHNIALSAVKGLCIILVVAGHSGCPQWIWRFIYLFHVPCFMLVSGYFLTDKSIQDFSSSIFKKVKGLWLPFVVWTIIFILLHNVLFDLHLNRSAYSWNEMKYKCWDSVYFISYEHLLFQLWFLKALFWASVSVILGLKLLKVILPKMRYEVILPVLIVIDIIATYAIYNFGGNTHSFYVTLGMSIAFFLSGMLVRTLSIERKGSVTAGLLMLGAVWIASVWYSAEILYLGNTMIIFYIAAMIASLGLIFTIKGLRTDSKLIIGLDYIGCNSMIIFVLHSLAFRPLCYLQTIVYDRPISDIIDYPIPLNDNIVFSVAYVVVGVALPLMLSYIFVCTKRYLWILKDRMVQNMRILD